MRFSDRQEAGRRLGLALGDLRARGTWWDPIVLAISSGGVPVGAEAARVLGLPLDVLVVRKVGAPGQPEAAVGAVVGDDAPVFDRSALRMLGVGEDELVPEVSRQRRELRRRERLYRRGRPAPELRRRTVLLVDDGLAKGVTAYAALRRVRSQHPAAVVLAVPVCDVECAADLRREADALVCVQPRLYLHAVGVSYEDFHDVGDQEVLALLRRQEAA
ncbi:phosphoribosyltransferase [Streptacidiphilus neutrinimicus]|uniref:phosphoribosyltransferase n=1 Tax=Streptacidiphilus neutrinimicus TaxID=105420 RepID=UPI0005AB8B8C|nr:phosphoribosyltransferase family protein [Streptacidiphilus neutrinimicus]